LYHRQAMPTRDRHYLVHLARHARIVHYADRLCSGAYGRLEQSFVNIERVCADVHENRDGTAQNEGIRGRDEGERRHDHLVARTQIKQQGGYLERRRATVGEQAFGGTGVGFQPGVATLRKHPIPGEMALRVSFFDQVEFAARHIGLIKGEHGEALDGAQSSKSGSRANHPLLRTTKPVTTSSSPTSLGRVSASPKKGTASRPTS